MTTLWQCKKWNIVLVRKRTAVYTAIHLNNEMGLHYKTSVSETLFLGNKITFPFSSPNPFNQSNI